MIHTQQCRCCSRGKPTCGRAGPRFIHHVRGRGLPSGVCGVSRRPSAAPSRPHAAAGACALNSATIRKHRCTVINDKAPTGGALRLPIHVEQLQRQVQSNNRSPGAVMQSRAVGYFSFAHEGGIVRSSFKCTAPSGNLRPQAGVVIDSPKAAIELTQTR